MHGHRLAGWVGAALVLTLSAAGAVRFRGFYGQYEARVQKGQRTWRFAFELKRGPATRREFTLPHPPGD